MRYRTKLTLMFVGGVLLSNGLLFALMYTRARDLLMGEVRSKVTSIAATTAALLDGDAHAALKAREDERRPEYADIEAQLRRARDANRRDDVHVKFLYTMMQAPQDPKVILFGVDPEESMADKSHLGDVYHATTESASNGLTLHETRAEAEMVHDQWGSWLAAQAPIRDSAGKAVGAVGVDISATEAVADVRTLLHQGYWFLALAGAFAVMMSMLLARRATRPLDALKTALHKIGEGNLDAKVELTGHDEFTQVGAALNTMAAGLRERSTLKEVLAKYLSRNVAAQIISSGQVPKLHGDRRKVTVLFADIRGFTKMSDGMAPEQVVALLNEYFERMIEVIFKYHGTLDKFIGDGLMAVFGAPLEDSYQERNAVSAALEMQQALAEMCKRWESKGLPPLRIGIGINTGIALVGNIGSTQRMEYTAIGDTVNLASRLEHQTKALDVSILISEYTYVEIRNAFRTKQMGHVEIRGRADAVSVYSVEDRRETRAAAA